MNLFDVPVELVAPDTARALIDQFGYDERKVRRWTREKGETVLAKRRREQALDKSQGDARAAVAAPEERPAVNGRELAARIDAARYLKQELAEGDPEVLLIALTYALFPLAATEVQDFARLVVTTLLRHPVGGHLLTAPDEEVAA